MGEGGVKIWQNLRDIFFEWAQGTVKGSGDGRIRDKLWKEGRERRNGVGGSNDGGEGTKGSSMHLNLSPAIFR